MSRQHLTRLDRLEAALQPPTPDPLLEARFRRACERLAAVLAADLPESIGPVFCGGDPARLLAEAERRAQCADH